MKKETILQFYQNYRLYIFPAIVVISSLILIIFILIPQLSKLIANQQAEGDLINKSKFLEVKAQTLESYDPADLNRKAEFATGALPTDKDFVSALGLLQDLAAQSGFNTVSMSLGASSAKSGNTQSFGVSLSLVGLNRLLPILFSHIENYPRLMRIGSVEANLSNEASSSAAVSLNVDVLYSSAPIGFGSIDSPLPELSEKDEEVIVKLAKAGVSANTGQTPTQLGPRGKANPFE